MKQSYRSNYRLVFETIQNFAETIYSSEEPGDGRNKAAQLILNNEWIFSSLVISAKIKPKLLVDILKSF